MIDPHVGRQNLTRGDWALIVLLAAVNFTHILDFVIIMPLGERLMQSLHLNAQQFGFVVAAYGFAATVSGVAAAFVADRFDRRSWLLISYAGFVLATFFCGLADTYELLMLARVLAGVFGGLAAAGIMAVIGDLFPDRHRGKAIGAVTSSFAVASILGLPIGLYLAEKFNSYGVPFLAIGGLSVVVWVVAWVRLPAVRHHLTGRTEDARAAFAAVLRQPSHLWSFAFMFTLVLGTFTIIPYLAPHLQINCGRSRLDIPGIYAVAGGCTLIGMNLIGWLADRFGKRPTFLVVAFGTMAMTVVITNLPPVSFLGAAAAASAFMVMAAGRVVPAQGMMLASADPSRRGAFTTLNSAMSHLATAVGPLISGLILRTETAVNEAGMEEIVRLERYPLAGLVAVGFAATAVGLSFALRPASPVRSRVVVRVTTQTRRPAHEGKQVVDSVGVDG